MILFISGLYPPTKPGGEPFLDQSGLAAGVGSNDIGLDRGQLGPTRVVRFERVDPKVLLVQSNLGLPGDQQRAR